MRGQTRLRAAAPNRRPVETSGPTLRRNAEYGIDVEPRRGAVIARAREEIGQKLPCRRVEIEMVGEYSGRLRGVADACAPRLEVQDQPIDRGIDADESAVAPPRDQIDMRIALHQTANRMHAARGPKVDRPANPASGNRATTSGSMRFQGGTSTGRKRGPKLDARPARPVASSASVWPPVAGVPSSQLRAPGGAWLRCA